MVLQPAALQALLGPDLVEQQRHPRAQQDAVDPLGFEVGQDPVELHELVDRREDLPPGELDDLPAVPPLDPRTPRLRGALSRSSSGTITWA
jgi:hypothetical protein